MRMYKDVIRGGLMKIISNKIMNEETIETK
jgi:hypothetical protein